MEEGRHQADKIDNSYGHGQLWDANFRYGDYIDYSRGRVIWDTTNNKAIINVDPCIKNEKVLAEITEKFELVDGGGEGTGYTCTYHVYLSERIHL